MNPLFGNMSSYSTQHFLISASSSCFLHHLTFHHWSTPSPHPPALVMPLSALLPPSPSLPPSLAWRMVCWGEADGRWVRDCPCQPLTLGSIQAGEMIDVKSNFKHPQFNSGRQTESGGQRLATQLGQPDKTSGSSLPAGVFVCACVCLCVLPSYLKQLTWHGSHLSCTERGVGGHHFVSFVYPQSQICQCNPSKHNRN